MQSKINCSLKSTQRVRTNRRTRETIPHDKKFVVPFTTLLVLGISLFLYVEGSMLRLWIWCKVPSLVEGSMLRLWIWCKVPSLAEVPCQPDLHEVELLLYLPDCVYIYVYSVQYLAGIFIFINQDNLLGLGQPNAGGARNTLSFFSCPLSHFIRYMHFFLYDPVPTSLLVVHCQ